MVMMGGGGGGWSTMRALREEEAVKAHKLTRGTFTRVMRFARPYRRDIALFLLTVIVSAVIGVLTPVLAGYVVNAINDCVDSPNASSVRSSDCVFGGCASLSSDSAGFFNVPPITTLMFSGPREAVAT